jgi:hypothetical protein
MLLTAQLKQVKAKLHLVAAKIVVVKIVLAAHHAVTAAELVAANKGLVL